MAMTKAEKAEMERLRGELSLALALRWSGATEPPRLEWPQEWEAFVNGWMFNEHRSAPQAVYPVWTERNAHGYGHRFVEGDRKNASQNGIRPFASKLDAAVALRLVVERQCALRLAEIDALIDEALAERAS